MNARIAFRMGFLVCLLMVAARVPNACAQSGEISCDVISTSDGTAVPGALVRAESTKDSTIHQARYATALGKVRFKKLAAGTYRVKATSLGFAPANTQITVDDGASKFATISMAPEPLQGGTTVVTASKDEEQLRDAPASIHVLDAHAIQTMQAVTAVDPVVSVPGIDVGQLGIAQQSVASRGFNSPFSGGLDMLIDNRMIALPAVGGNFGLLTPTMPEELDRVEVVRGPGAVLYGPAAAEGVAHFITRSPFSSQGTVVSLAGGERSYTDLSLRHAQSLGENVAFKLSGKYFKAHEWGFTDPLEATAQQAALAGANLLSAADTAKFLDTVKIGNRTPNTEVYGVEGRVDGLIGDMAATVSGGYNYVTSGVQQTNTGGAVQGLGWSTSYVQGRLSFYNVFLNAYLMKDNSASSYFLRSGTPLEDHSGLLALQAQHNWMPFSSERLVYGIDYFSTTPTDVAVYGVHSGNVTSNQLGAYLQSSTQVVRDRLDVVLSARMDTQTEVDGWQLSPRVAMIWKPETGHTLKLSFNSTASMPQIDLMYYDLNYGSIPGTPTNIYVGGIHTAGERFEQGADGSYIMHSAWAPQAGAIPSSQGAAALWTLLQGIAVQYGITLPSTAPTPQQVGTVLAMLNTSTQSFDLVTKPLNDIAKFEPQRHRVWEAEYHVQITNDIEASIDVFNSHYDNFQANPIVVTPSVFVNPVQLAGYLYTSYRQSGMDSATAMGTATAAANALGRIPIGTVTASGSAHPNDIMLAYGPSFGTFDFNGLDLYGMWHASSAITLQAGVSYMSKNYVEHGDASDPNSAPLAMNAPKYKSFLALRYEGIAQGLSGEVRHRWYDGFKAYTFADQGEIAARHVVDLTMNYTIPSFNQLRLTLGISNLLNNSHQELAGAPNIGRMGTLRAVYTLPAL
jgi:outer membrane receptor for ferrienterochelin and colicins